MTYNTAQIWDKNDTHYITYLDEMQKKRSLRN